MPDTETQKTPQRSGTTACSCGAWDQEYRELIDEINTLNAKVFELEKFPRAVLSQVEDDHRFATERWKAAKQKAKDVTTDPMVAYWEGQTHAIANFQRWIARETS